MAELSIACAVLAFIGASVDTVDAVRELISSIRGAPRGAKILLQELDELGRVFKRLNELSDKIKKCPEQDLHSSAPSQDFRDRCTSDLDELHKLVNGIHLQLTRRGYRRVVARIKWSVSEKTPISRLMSRIQTHRDLLMTFLSELQSRCALHMIDKVGGVRTAVEVVGTTVEVVGTAVEVVRTGVSACNSLLRQTAESSTRTSTSMACLQRSLDAMIRKPDRTNQAPRSLEQPCWVNVYPANGRFYGRDDILAQIERALLGQPSETTKLRSVSLQGMWGVGKTQIALQFIHTHQNEFQAIFWITADSREKIIQGFVDVARALKLEAADTPVAQSKSVQLVKDWLADSDQPWLVVFDNADKLEILHDYWPATQRGAVLVTCRNPESLYSLPASGIKVSPFEPEDGVQFFLSVLKDAGRDDDAKKAATINEALGGLPLALNQMASYIRESGCSLATFLKIYSDRGQANELQENPGTVGELWYKHTVAKAVDIIILNLDQNTVATLEMLAFFDPDEIPVSLLHDKSQKIPFLSSELHVNSVVMPLVRFSLVDKNTNKTGLTYSIHRLVRDAALRRLSSEHGRRQLAFDHSLHLIQQAFPAQCSFRQHMTELWPDCEVFVPHVVSLHEQYTDMIKEKPLSVSGSFINLLYNCSWYLFERGRFDLGLTIARTAETVYQIAQLGDHGLLLADIYTVYGAIYIEMTQVERANKYFKDALDIREAAVKEGYLEPDHPQVANSYMNLGVSLANETDKTKEVIQLHQKAIIIREESPKFKDSQAQMWSLNYLNIGRCYWMENDLEEASNALKKSLQIIEENYVPSGPKFVQTGMAKWALGNVKIKQQQLPEALDLHRECMELLEELLGPTHLKTIACYHKVAWFLHKQQEFRTSIDLLRLALEKHEEAGLDRRAEIARTKFKLAEVLHDAGEIVEANKYRSDAGKLRLDITGKRPSETDTEEVYDELVAYFYR